MKRLISAAVLLLPLLTVAYAVDFNNLQNYVGFYNNKIESAPEVLKSMIGDEKVGLTIVLNNGSTLRWGMELDSAKITRSGYGDLEDSTIEIKATEYAINKVLHAQDPIATYHEVEKSGQIAIEGKSFKADAKILAALGMASVMNSFIGSLI